MLITDKEILKNYYTEARQWQGIPSLDITKNGRIFATWYSGGHTEMFGNYCLLVYSDDGGLSFSEPIAVIDVGGSARAYDPCVFCDPLGRLWFFYSVMPNNRVEYVLCNDPDGAVLLFEEPRVLCEGEAEVMLNRPIVRRDGAWLFPTAVWSPELTVGSVKKDSMGARCSKTGAKVHITYDGGKTFELGGCVTLKDRWYDEHRLLERENGDIEIYIRTTYGVGRSLSRDGGMTFAGDEKAFDGPNSRIAIIRLSSGNILLVNHVDFIGRNNLTAVLYDKDFSPLGSLLLDARANVSYPDAQEHNGYIYVIYDRERGAIYDPNCDYTDSAREILLAKVREEDIITGNISAGSFLAQTVSKILKKEA